MRNNTVKFSLKLKAGVAMQDYVQTRELFAFESPPEIDYSLVMVER